MKPEYYIGIDMIDEEHKQLFKYADEAYELLHDEFTPDKYDRIDIILENNIIIITTPLNTRIFIYILLTDNFPLVTYTFTLILLNYITIPSSTQALILLNFNCCI